MTNKIEQSSPVSSGVLNNSIMQSISNLNSGYFALIMATGIVSIASYLLDIEPVAWTLFGINILAYLILWFFLLIRLFRYFSLLKADLMNPGVGPGFFTIIAGTCVLGTQFVIIAKDLDIATLLWFLGLLVWIVLIYSFITAIIINEKKPSIDVGLNGSWLVIVVSTQSISILGTLVAPQFTAWQNELLFFTVAMYLLGCMFYVLIITLIFYRFSFFTFDPKDMTPPYWINMGATAITTLAGATLIQNVPTSGGIFFEEILPFLVGFTVFFWVFGTWWIPLLFILGAWRHIYKRFPLNYHPSYWGMVFPMGMYTTCTIKLAEAIELPFLKIIPVYFIYIALLAWTITFFGLLHRIVDKLILLPSSQRIGL